MPKSSPLVFERADTLIGGTKTLIIDMPAGSGLGGNYSIQFYRHKLLASSQDELHIAVNATWNGTSWVQDDSAESSYLIRIGTDVAGRGKVMTFEGQPPGTGPWADTAWVKGMGIAPADAGRALFLEDMQIAWDNTTTGATGANPPASTAIKNVLSAKNTIKAWGIVETDTGGEVIHEGFGISSATISGTDLQIGFSALMDSTDYAVVCTENVSALNGLIPSITFKSGTAFRVRMTHHNGTVYNAGGATTWYVGFIVMGIHNT